VAASDGATTVSPESPASDADWDLVLARDGTVLAAAEGTPASWVGRRLDDCDGAPEDVKEATYTVLERAYHEAAPLALQLRLESNQRIVRLRVVDALPLRRVPTNLGALLHSCLEVMRPQAKATDIRLEAIVDERVPPLLVIDADKVAWIVTALIGNALRYVHHGSIMMPSGSIVVRATYNSAGPDVTLEVQDDGPGITRERLRALFGAGPRHRPLALGLLMVREVVAAHGGHLEVHSDTDAFLSGTTVRLTLPVS